MNTWIGATILVTAAAGAAAAFTTSFHGDAESDQKPDPSVVEVLRRLDELEARLTREIDDLRRQQTATLREAVVAADEAAAAAPAVASKTVGTTPAPDSSAAVAPTGEPLDLEQALADLAAAADWDEQEGIWSRIIEAGLIDEVLAKMEEMVEQDPTNADLRVDLGSAYLQKLFTVGDGPQKGLWAIKADGTFDQALAIDPRHWTARFSKATSLSFWPPLFGKQAEAISQFETLIYQQEETGAATKPEFAQSYVFLGNLYQQQGDEQKAKETWAKGFNYFPGNEELAEKVK